MFQENPDQNQNNNNQNNPKNEAKLTKGQVTKKYKEIISEKYKFLKGAEGKGSCLILSGPEYRVLCLFLGIDFKQEDYNEIIGKGAKLIDVQAVLKPYKQDIVEFEVLCQKFGIDNRKIISKSKIGDFRGFEIRSFIDGSIDGAKLMEKYKKSYRPNEQDFQRTEHLIKLKNTSLSRKLLPSAHEFLSKMQEKTKFRLEKMKDITVFFPPKLRDLMEVILERAVHNKELKLESKARHHQNYQPLGQSQQIEKFPPREDILNSNNQNNPNFQIRNEGFGQITQEDLDNFQEQRMLQKFRKENGFGNGGLFSNQNNQSTQQQSNFAFELQGKKGDQSNINEKRKGGYDLDGQENGNNGIKKKLQPNPKDDQNTKGGQGMM